MKRKGQTKKKKRIKQKRRTGEEKERRIREEEAWVKGRPVSDTYLRIHIIHRPNEADCSCPQADGCDCGGAFEKAK